MLPTHTKIKRVLKNHPALIEKHSSIKQPPEEELTLARHYELLREHYELVDERLFSQDHPASAELYYKGYMHGWGQNTLLRGSSNI